MPAKDGAAMDLSPSGESETAILSDVSSSIPDDPNALLTRERLAHALTQAGYPVKPKTLATKATRGGGPPYQLWGTRALYRWCDALVWAQARLSHPRVSTSTTDVE